MFIVNTANKPASKNAGRKIKRFIASLFDINNSVNILIFFFKFQRFKIFLLLVATSYFLICTSLIGIVAGTSPDLRTIRCPCSAHIQFLKPEPNPANVSREII